MKIYKFMITLTSIMIMTMVMTIAAHFLPTRKTNLEKASPYECGFDPLKSARMPFSFRFFLVAILFLLFDLEMALLFPFPTSTFVMETSSPVMTMSMFLIILTLGLMFEWLQGGLDWAE